jgi:uncharacterized protein (UPF0303 family)
MEEEENSNSGHPAKKNLNWVGRKKKTLIVGHTPTNPNWVGRKKETLMLLMLLLLL